MDNVYDLALTPEVDKKAEGVSFRFMPEMKQVQKALEVREITGMDLAGVPLFVSRSASSVAAVVAQAATALKPESMHLSKQWPVRHCVLDLEL